MFVMHDRMQHRRAVHLPASTADILRAVRTACADEDEDGGGLTKSGKKQPKSTAKASAKKGSLAARYHCALRSCHSILKAAPC
jgi:hypothetical protein